MNNNRCDHCGAKIVKYKHSLNKRMIACLMTVAKNLGVMPFSELNKKHSFNDCNNFQKLRYWDVISKSEDGKGIWKITEAGWKFLAGKIRLNKSVVTYRGTRDRYEGKFMFVKEFGYEYYREKEDYVDDQESSFI